MVNKKLQELYDSNSVRRCSECGGWAGMKDNRYTCKVCKEQLSWGWK